MTTVKVPPIAQYLRALLGSEPRSLRSIPEDVFAEVVAAVPPDQADEMALPSYRHKNLALRSMAWGRVFVMGQRLEALARAHPGPRKPAIMDYGCGVGVLLERASGLSERVYGVDLVLEGAEVVVKRRCADNVTLLSPAQAEARIPKHSLDIIVAGEVLEHLEPLSDTLALFRSLLAPGGRLLASLPTENALYRLGRRIAGFSGHYHHSDAARIDREIRACGFAPVDMLEIPFGGPLSIYWIIEYAAAQPKPKPK